MFQDSSMLPYIKVVCFHLYVNIPLHEDMIIININEHLIVWIGAIKLLASDF